jgi:hypothetical protein
MKCVFIFPVTLKHPAIHQEDIWKDFDGINLTACGMITTTCPHPTAPMRKLLFSATDSSISRWVLHGVGTFAHEVPKFPGCITCEKFTLECKLQCVNFCAAAMTPTCVLLWSILPRCPWLRLKWGGSSNAVETLSLVVMGSPRCSLLHPTHDLRGGLGIASSNNSWRPSMYTPSIFYQSVGVTFGLIILFRLNLDKARGCVMRSQKFH